MSELPPEDQRPDPDLMPDSEQPDPNVSEAASPDDLPPVAAEEPAPLAEPPAEPTAEAALADEPETPTDADPEATPVYPPILPPEPPPADDSLAAEQEPDPAPAARRARPIPGRTLRLPQLIAGVGLIVLGVLLAWPALAGSPLLPDTLSIGIGALILCVGLLAYWSGTGRLARGAFFLAVAALAWGGLSFALTANTADANLSRTWPLFATALGVAVLVTYIFDAQRETRLLAPGLILIVAGLAAAAVTWGMLPADVLDLIRQIGPWLFVVLALGLLPLAIRREPRQD
jgi:hypothetical protein